MSTARYAMGSCGVYASAISAGGWVSPSHTNAVESWNGSSWTEISEINTSRNEIGGAGASNTSALIFGGVPNNPSVESWDGSSWTETTELNNGRAYLAGDGIQTAAIAIGGEPGPGAADFTEIWNGSTWTEVSDLNLARTNLASSKVGTTTASLAFGGSNSGFKNETESWDGTSWTEVADLATARQNLSGAGTNSLGLAFAGTVGTPGLTNTEEWTLVHALKKVTTG